jgi:hypothetical protein
MLLTLLAASEPSKVPWYIGGGVLVLWAVVLAFLGLRSPTFPGGVVGQRGVIALSLVLAVVAMGTAVYAK